jgi:prepilin-type N-terminal cleavage/methylation domain-containing protein
MSNKKGFTLIELLVVIAIIGILSAVVLASLNSARNKGADAAIKSGLANARAQAELYYDTNGATIGYSGVCADQTNGIKKMKDSVNTTAGSATCADATSSWAMSAPLKSVTGNWCVDSTGASGSSTVSGTKCQ